MLSKQSSLYRTLLSTVFCLLFLSPLNARPLKYLYINAREGSASGGHTALRFNNETFHFQHYEGGIIRLVRHDSVDFDFQYRYADNRTLYQATVDLKDVHYEQLHDYFNLVFLQQKQQDSLLNEVSLNIALLQTQTQNQNQDQRLQINGAGLFTQKTAPHGAIEYSTIHSLQQKIEQTYGVDFLYNQIQRFQKEVNSLQPLPWANDLLQLSDNSFLAVHYSFASQHIDTVSKILFLETIKNSNPLNTHQYFIPRQSSFKLSKLELEKLSIFQQTLINNLVSLLNSQRPGWGEAAFALYARILSLSLSIDSGSFVFLDSFTTGSYSIPYTEVETYRGLLKAQKITALTKIIQEKNQLFTAHQTISEKDYSRLEMLSNYYYERERGLTENRSIRVSGEQLLPTKSTPLPSQLFPRLSPEQSTKALNRLEQYRENLTEQMHTLYRYDLFTRNCVTEIFDTIDKAEINDRYIEEIEQLAQNNLIAFIPFGSFYSLSTDYQKRTFPSFRHQQLTKMYQQENNALVYLREFNTLSARHYKFNDQDSAFLFFTDDKVWTRPLFGTFNLLTAATISVYGGFTLPFDSGTTLKNGVMGILMSLPELAFFNIRKGSYKHLLPPLQAE
ncbi:MAG: hypothetical protein GQ529_11625 [Methyloprofundus sp.]|nr:hypothetical protein [Methyloprofundus sp.]